MHVVVRCQEVARRAGRALLALSLCGLAATAAHAAAAPAGASAVLECMRANVPKTLTVRDIQLSASDRKGSTRTLQGRIYASREDDKLRAMIRIAAPADLAGAAYLLRERESGDEMYVYMPALQKVRRISGAAIDGSLWGTDLSYADVKQLTNAFSGAQPKLDRDETVAGRAMHVLSVAPTVAAARFDRVRAWVDARTCMALRVDFEQAGVAQKRLTIEPGDLQQSGSYWYATQILVSDLKQGSKTTVKVTGITPDKELADRLFGPATFYLGN
ncbi:outer membrane lipoprotein-sorting protein [Solimonas soli]|uniref:outer membrane lipoprotein-sorting protein n=1 Tax=Solimonas soli TaxID=413479 RepID=UPI00047FF3A5|nr:outer membrane lipoprotein-sorting protein [Solimonas soli]